MSSPTTDVTAPATLKSNHIFTVKVYLTGERFQVNLFGGGIRIVEPIVKGVIDGPNFQATIAGGVAAPIIRNDTPGDRLNATQSPYIYAYGRTSDGHPFYLHEEGIGNTNAQNTKLVMEVGGPYTYMQKLFIVATLNLVRKKGTDEIDVVEVECYNVSTVS
ncbi:hypothetical protein M426DRAFT_63572 [Hypoxylon sp. CI-4A]|nr:hypothetical protein M426DRAFT_63572 [Hypoxylon sp. CI-4A]